MSQVRWIRGGILGPMMGIVMALATCGGLSFMPYIWACATTQYIEEVGDSHKALDLIPMVWNAIMSTTDVLQSGRLRLAVINIIHVSHVSHPGGS